MFSIILNSVKSNSHFHRDYITCVNIIQHVRNQILNYKSINKTKLRLNQQPVQQQTEYFPKTIRDLWNTVSLRQIRSTHCACVNWSVCLPGYNELIKNFGKIAHQNSSSRTA